MISNQKRLDCFEKVLEIPFSVDFNAIKSFLDKKFPDYQVLRFTSSSFDKNSFKAHVLLINQNLNSNIFKFKARKYESHKNFNACFLIPTGIGCEIGGHAGDGNPALKLIASSCDTVVTHPNVVNASDINEMPENALYVEGHHITDFLMGNIGLNPVKQNRVLVLIDNQKETCKEKKRFVDLTINSVNSARATLGLEAEIQLLSNDFKMEAFLENDRAMGSITHLESVINTLKPKKDNFDAIAISSPIVVPEGTHKVYSTSNGNMINPWGGVESMLTHTISSVFNKPSAHAPMLENMETFLLDLGVVDSRIAPEIVSSTFLHCVLKGLHKAPSIVQAEEGLSVQDISALVIPDGVLGLPVLSALHQGIKVIAVKNKNTMKNQLSLLPWKKGQFIQCDNYLEASGVLNCLKEGVSIESIKRPFKTLNKKEEKQENLNLISNRNQKTVMM